MKKATIIMLLAAAMLPALGQAQTVNICDRTPQVRDSIVAAAGAEDCAAVDSESLAGVTELVITYGTNSASPSVLKSLRAGDFDGLTSLQSLDLSRNLLVALPEGIFDGLTSLQELLLWGGPRRTYDLGGQLAELPEGIFDGLTSLQTLNLDHNQLAALPEGAFDGLTSLQALYLNDNQLAALPEGVFDGLTSLQRLNLSNNQLAALPEGAFDGLTNLAGSPIPGDYAVRINSQALCEYGRSARPDNYVAPPPRHPTSSGGPALNLSGNQLTTLPTGVFDGLTRLGQLDLGHNQLTALPEGVFNGLTSVDAISLDDNQLAALPEGAFAGLRNLKILSLHNNRLTALREDVFTVLSNLWCVTLWSNQLATLPAGVFNVPSLYDSLTLNLSNNRLAALPAGVFSGVTVKSLDLSNNMLTTLTPGVFSGLTVYGYVILSNNRLAALPAGVFNGLRAYGLVLSNNQLATLPVGLLDGMRTSSGSGTIGLNLSSNQLASLPEGVFNGWSFGTLDLRDNPANFQPDDPAFAGASGQLLLEGYTGRILTPEEPEQPATRLAAAVPLMVSASDSMRQGFVRIINESDESGGVRILAFDDGGTAAEPIEIQLGANQAIHFNAGDLENGNANKGIATGIGLPVQGDWRLDVESALDVRVIAFVRTGDGFLTAMNETLPRDGRWRLVAHTFNPGSNDQSVSSLRLVNAGDSAESVGIEGVDDQGNNAGPVTLTLAAGESRTLSALDLEEGAQGLSGTLGDGAGKWRLFITAGQSVVGASLLEAATGHVTNLSIEGVSTADQP